MKRSRFAQAFALATVLLSSSRTCQRVKAFTPASGGVRVAAVGKEGAKAQRSRRSISSCNSISRSSRSSGLELCAAGSGAKEDFVPDAPALGDDTPPFHVHFGAGRLGLGLILKAIVDSKVPCAIVQRPKTTWRAVTSQGCGAEIDLQVNGEVVADNVVVISEDCDVNEFLQMEQGNDDHTDILLAVVNERDTLLQLVRKATSFSSSLGPAMKKVMVPLFQELPTRPDGGRPVLYACENDHDAARRIGDLVKDRVETIPCMVDRICTARTIEPEFVDVSTEPKFEGAIVAMGVPPQQEFVPLAGEGVVIPKSVEEAKYLYKRKVSIINGMHTVHAFMTLRKEDAQMFDNADYDLLTYATASPVEKMELWAWAVARSTELISEFGVDVMMSAHNVETEEELFDILIAYAKQALERFSSVQDKTSRVLGGGVGNRWASRLKPTATYLSKTVLAESGLPEERFMLRAGVVEAFARQVVIKLMEDTMRFCRKDVQDAVKELLAFSRQGGASVAVGDTAVFYNADGAVPAVSRGGPEAVIQQQQLVIQQMQKVIKQQQEQLRTQKELHKQATKSSSSRKA